MVDAEALLNLAQVVPETRDKLPQQLKPVGSLGLEPHPAFAWAHRTNVPGGSNGAPVRSIARGRASSIALNAVQVECNVGGVDIDVERALAERVDIDIFRIHTKASRRSSSSWLLFLREAKSRAARNGNGDRARGRN